MRSTLLVLFLIAITPLWGMSLKQLEEGALAMTAQKSGAEITDKQTSDALLFMGYYWGYFQSIQNSGWLAVDGAKNPTKNIQPAKWMYELDRGASSILDFISKVKSGKATPDIAAGPIMTAWYLWSQDDREDAGGLKFLAVEILNSQMGRNFGGKEEMTRAMGKQFATEIQLKARREEAAKDKSEKKKIPAADR